MRQNDTSSALPLHQEILFNEEEIAEQINLLASSIVQQFKDTNPLFVCLLRGGIPFASRLMFAIAKLDPYFQPEVDYMAVSLYGDKQTASTPTILSDLRSKTAVANRPVIVLDDMIDKGGTYACIKKLLEDKGASAVYLAVLVQRELEQPRGFDADFYCFSVPSQEWLTGMGLDDTRVGIEGNRWAGYIAAANSPT